MHDPLKPSNIHTSLNVLRLVAITVFVVVWGVQMYLSILGPPVPSASTGAIYPVTIHGGVTYANMWQYYFATRGTLAVSSCCWHLTFFCGDDTCPRGDSDLNRDASGKIQI